MVFLYPSFLWALTAVAIPVIIHILNFRTRKTIYFSNVDLLENIEQESKSRNRLKELLILLFRILTIVSLVIVFAHPVKRTSSAIKGLCRKYQSVFVDNSFSMSLMNSDIDNLSTAKAKATDIFESFSPDTKFLTFDNGLNAPQKYFYPRDIAKDNISKMGFSAHQRKLSFIIENFLRTYKLNGLNCKPDIFIISDFQKSFVDEDNLQPDTNYNLYLIPVQSNSPLNIYIDSVWFDSPFHIAENPDSVNVLVVNASNQEVVNRQMEFFINDTLKTMTSFDLKPNEKKQIKIKYVNTAKGYLACKLHLSDYPVVFDNSFYFNYYIAPKIKLLLVEGSRNKMIETFYKNDKYFELDISTNNLPVSELSSYNAVILNDVRNISLSNLDYLYDYVNNGGIVVFIATDDKDINNAFVRKFGLPFFKNQINQHTLINNIDLNDKIYKNSILSVRNDARFPFCNSYWQVSGADASVDELLKFENQDPFLLYKNEGKGSVYVFTANLDKNNSDFMLHPLCSPTMYNIPLFTQSSNRIYYTQKDDIEIKINKTEGGDVVKMKATDKQTEFYPNVSQGFDFMNINLSGVSLPAATYVLISENDTIGMVSIDYASEESEMNFYTLEALDSLIKKKGLNNWHIMQNTSESIQKEIQEQTMGKSLRKIFVILALFFILAEILAIKLLK